MDDEVNLRDYLEVVWKRKFLVLALAIMVSLAFGWSSLSKKDLYEANATLLLKDSGLSLASSQLAGALGAGSGSQARNFPVLIKSRAVAEIVLDDLKLKERIKGWNNPATSKQSLIESVQSMPVFNSMDVFTVKVVTDDPQLSADLANAFTQAGQKYWRQMNYTEARKKREYIETQLPRLRAELSAAEKKLKEFSLLSPSPFSVQGIEANRLQREYTVLNDTYSMLRKEYEQVKLEESKELDPFSLIDSAVVPLEPIKPNVPLKFALGFVLGLFLGVAAAFGLEFWDKSKLKK